MIIHFSHSLKRYSIVMLLFIALACEDFVAIDPPRTELVKVVIFQEDATAEAAMTDIYFQLRASGFASGLVNSISYLTSLASDEQVNYYTGQPQPMLEMQQFNDNELQQNNAMILELWSGLYQCIYKANAILEGLAGSDGVSGAVRDRLTGEARFMRAFCLFYLVNLWGDVPLVTTTDYRTNASLKRAPEEDVYQQIIADLILAKTLLRDDYVVSKNQRVRPNRGAATALLARAYLYIDDWENTELQSTEVINNTTLYGLVTPLTDVFRSVSREAIFQVWHDQTPNDRTTFFIPSAGPRNAALRPAFATTFEAGDLRWSVWGRSRVVSGTTYYYAFKYASFGSVPPLDFSTVMRLSEQYLIRAEARTRRGNFSGAQDDLDIIRLRAGLTTTDADDEPELLAAIERERKAELYTEWGHRWFDLKRTGRAAAVLAPLKPQWDDSDELFPIPEYEIRNNASLKNSQNPGY